MALNDVGEEVSKLILKKSQQPCSQGSRRFCLHQQTSSRVISQTNLFIQVSSVVSGWFGRRYSAHRNALHPQKSHMLKWGWEEPSHWKISSCTSDISYYWNSVQTHAPSVSSLGRLSSAICAAAAKPLVAKRATVLLFWLMQIVASRC